MSDNQGSDERANKRLAYLEQLVAGGKADTFARYALAMEYKSRARYMDAKAAFEALRAADPGYVPMYLLCGVMLLDDLALLDEAREWLDAGLAAAHQKGDSKAAGEIGDALARARG